MLVDPIVMALSYCNSLLPITLAITLWTEVSSKFRFPFYLHWSVKISFYSSIWVEPWSKLAELSISVLVGRNIPGKGTTNAKDTRRDRAYHVQVTSEKASRLEHHKGESDRMLGQRDTGDMIDYTGPKTIRTWILFYFFSGFYFKWDR